MADENMAARKRRAKALRQMAVVNLAILENPLSVDEALARLGLHRMPGGRVRPIPPPPQAGPASPAPLSVPAPDAEPECAAPVVEPPAMPEPPDLPPAIGSPAEISQARRAMLLRMTDARVQPASRVFALVPTHRTSFLYVICDDGDLVKVGFSQDVEKRRQNLSTGSGRKLTVYAAEPIDAQRPAEAERAAHDLLARYRVRGEWFRCHPEVALAAVRRAAFLAEDGS